MLDVWHHYPETLQQCWTGDPAMFSLSATATRDAIVGLDTLRIFVSEEGFAALAQELTTRCGEGLTTLRCLYGDL